jgi:hypothetical protein
VGELIQQQSEPQQSPPHPQLIVPQRTGCAQMHTPFEHVSALLEEQARPQLPQFEKSVWTSTQVPPLPPSAPQRV